MEKIREWDIIGFGAVAVDDLIFVPNYPESDTKIEVAKRERFGGGLTGTALVAASRLGAAGAYCGILGKNDLSRFTLNEFKNEGVDTSLCIIVNDAQPLHSTIIIDQSTGRRTIYYSLSGFTPPDPALIQKSLNVPCKLVIFDSFMEDSIPHIIKTAHRKGIPVLADIESVDIMQQPESLASIDYLILNRILAEEITGEKEPDRVLFALETDQRICTVITKGKSGCWHKIRNEPVFHIPAFSVKEVDTTGCGDVFHGAFAAALVRGLDIQTAVMQASAAAAIKATQSGGRKGIPGLNQLNEFIGNYSGTKPENIS